MSLAEYRSGQSGLNNLKMSSLKTNLTKTTIEYDVKIDFWCQNLAGARLVIPARQFAKHLRTTLTNRCSIKWTKRYETWDNIYPSFQLVFHQVFAAVRPTDRHFQYNCRFRWFARVDVMQSSDETFATAPLPLVTVRMAVSHVITYEVGRVGQLYGNL